MTDRNASDDTAWCEDLLRRQRHAKAPQPIADVLSRLMARKGYAQALAADELRTLWESAVGGLLANDSRATTVSRGILQVVVRNSTVVQELTFRRKELLARIRELTKQNIRGLKFRVGDFD